MVNLASHRMPLIKFPMLNFKPQKWHKYLIAFSFIACFSPVTHALGPIVNAPSEFVFGTQGHLAKHADQLDSVHTVFSASGLNSYRDEFEWAWLEPQKGNLRFAGDDLVKPLQLLQSESLKENIYPLVELDFGNRNYWNTGRDDLTNPIVFDRFVNGFINYSKFMLQSLPEAKLFEIWNEWNLGMHLCDDGCPANIDKINDGKFYGIFLNRVAAAIKEMRPESIVLSQGLAINSKIGAPDNEFLVKSLNAGGVKYLDGIGLHPYSFADFGPERIYSYLISTRRQLYSEVPDYRFRPLPFYITEIGWPTSKGEGWGKNITETQQSNYMERVVLLARTLPYVKGLWLYDLVDDGDNADDNEHNFGLVHTNLSSKPSYEMVSCMTQPIIKGTEYRLLSGESDPTVTFIRAYWDQPKTVNYGVSFLHQEVGQPETAYSAFWVADGSHKKIQISTNATTPVTVSYSKGFCAQKFSIKLPVGGRLVLDVDDSPLYVSIPASQGVLNFNFMN